MTSSFWSSFETELAKAAAVAETEIKAAAQYFKPMLIAGAEEVATAALQSVLTQAPLLISGQEKLSAATANVVSTLAANGKSVAVSIAETAVQAAVNKLSPAKTA